MTDRRTKQPAVGDVGLGSALPNPVAVERMWSRIEQSTSRSGPFPRPQRGPLLLGAVGALCTFVLGVWVGRVSDTGLPESRRVSAEPLALAGGVAEPGTREVPTRAPTTRNWQAAAAAGYTRSDVEASEEPGVSGARALVSSPAPPLMNPSLGVTARAPRVAVNVAAQSPTPPGLGAAQAPVRGSSGAEQQGAAQTQLLGSGSAAPGDAMRWKLLASTGDYEAALFELSRTGGFDHAFSGADADGLLLLADVARATGQPGRAIASLRRLLRDHPASGNASVAAWSLGNLLEKAGDRVGAAQAFATYQALSPGGDFAEDAHIRRVRAAIADLDEPRAQRLSADYRRLYPKGRYLQALERWLDAAQWPRQGNAAAPNAQEDAVSEGGPSGGKELDLAEASKGPGHPAAPVPSGGQAPPERDKQAAEGSAKPSPSAEGTPPRAKPSPSAEGTPPAAKPPGPPPVPSASDDRRGRSGRVPAAPRSRPVGGRPPPEPKQ